MLCCTTGIACTNFPKQLNARTIHSFAGIQDCRGTKDTVIQLVQNNEAAKKRWMTTDVLIVDEVSMLSSRILEPLNAIAVSVRNNDNTFGELKIIVARDFYQLPPVPNQWDKGEFAFTSSLWDKAFSHCVVLVDIVRQNERELLLLIKEARLGAMKARTLPVPSAGMLSHKILGWNSCQRYSPIMRMWIF